MLDNELKDRKCFVGDKCIYADLAFVPWQRWGKFYATSPEALDEGSRMPLRDLLSERPSVKKVLADQDATTERDEREKSRDIG